MGGEKKWSCAYRAVRNFKVSNQEIGEMIGEVDLEGKDVDQVVEAWISNNKDRWKKWTECS
jgi:glycine betaine/proline transport system substrate-binding protein